MKNFIKGLVLKVKNETAVSKSTAVSCNYRFIYITNFELFRCEFYCMYFTIL
jgi:hypothetical protein